MIKTIIAAVITYLSTSIDEIPILFLMYRRTNNRGKGRVITLSYFFGTLLLVTVGILGALGLRMIQAKWLVGFIGLVPLVSGIKILLQGYDEAEEEAVASANQYNRLWVQVLAITIGLGADDLGVYIPLFTTLDTLEILLMLLIFIIGTAMLCLISFQMSRINWLSGLIERFERFITGITYTGIGILVIHECRMISKLLEILSA